MFNYLFINMEFFMVNKLYSMNKIKNLLTDNKMKMPTTLSKFFNI